MMRARRWLLGLALAIGASAAGCAKEKGDRAQTPAQRPTGLRMPRQPQTAPTTTHTAPPPTATAPAPSATATATATATASASGGLSPQDLIRFQDACWKSCDQFACMKIAEAYKTGVGLPQDVLAGRRYAAHACAECGAPSLAVADQCPAWGFEKK